MGHVFDFNEAVAYEHWLQKPQSKKAFELERQLMRDLLQPLRGETVLDIGCGTGACLAAFLEMGLRVTGLDPSSYMLDLALKKIGNRAELYRGYAEDLPFDDNSFSYACLFTTNPPQGAGRGLSGGQRPGLHRGVQPLRHKGNSTATQGNFHAYDFQPCSVFQRLGA